VSALRAGKSLPANIKIVTIASMLCRSVALHAATDFGEHHDARPDLLDRCPVEEIG
jgi:hypothetical protein